MNQQSVKQAAMDVCVTPKARRRLDKVFTPTGPSPGRRIAFVGRSPKSPAQQVNLVNTNIVSGTRPLKANFLLSQTAELLF